MRICVFCASGKDIPEPYPSALRELGIQMGERGHSLVFGGYDTGLMGVIAKAVHDGGGKVTGIVPHDIERFRGRPVFPCDEVITVSDLSERKARMVDISEAFVTAPGGLGTFDELFDVLALQKVTGRSRPMGLYDVNGYFAPVVASIERSIEAGFSPEATRGYYRATGDVGELLDYIEANAEA